MTRKQARANAKFASRRYCTFWYVVELKPGFFQPMAHVPVDMFETDTFHCGKEWGV